MVINTMYKMMVIDYIDPIHYRKSILDDLTFSVIRDFSVFWHHLGPTPIKLLRGNSNANSSQKILIIIITLSDSYLFSMLSTDTLVHIYDQGASNWFDILTTPTSSFIIRRDSLRVNEVKNGESNEVYSCYFLKLKRQMKTTSTKRRLIILT